MSDNIEAVRGWIQFAGEEDEVLRGIRELLAEHDAAQTPVALATREYGEATIGHLRAVLPGVQQILTGGDGRLGLAYVALANAITEEGQHGTT